MGGQGSDVGVVRLPGIVGGGSSQHLHLLLLEATLRELPTAKGSRLESSSHGINDRMKSLTKGHVTTSPISYRSRQFVEATDFDGVEDDRDSLLSLRELRSEINDARLESLDRSFEDPDHPPLGTRLDRSLRGY